MNNICTRLRLLLSGGAKNIIGYITSILLLFYLIKSSNIQLIQLKLLGNSWLYFLASMGILFFSFILYALRAKFVWRTKKLSVKNVYTYKSLLLGLFFNNIFPGNLGEGVRAWHFSKRNNVTFIQSFAGIVTEKWLDAQIFALAIFFLFFKKVPFGMISYMLAGTASIVMILTLLRSFLLQQKKIEKQFWRIIIKTGKVGRFLYKLYVHTNNQLKSMSTNGNIIWYFAFSLIILFLNAAQFFLLFKTVAIPPPIASGYTAILISLSMMIIAFIPSAPGNIGVLHYGVYSVLIFVSKSYDIPSNKMLLANYALFGIYAHLSFFLPEIIIGIIILQSELWGKNEKINIWFLKKYFPPFL